MRKWIWVIIIAVMYLTAMSTEPVAAGVSGQSVEFTITEKLTLEGDGTDCNLTAQPGAIEIINSGNREIIVEKLKAEQKNGWTLVRKNCDFSRLAANSKKISITLAGGHDLIDEYPVGQTLKKGENVTIHIAAKTGAVTSAVLDECVVDLIATVSTMEFYEYPIIDFLEAEETFDHSEHDYGVTRTIVGADSLKLSFDRVLYLCTTGEDHTIVIDDGDGERHYNTNLFIEELIVPGDTATLWVNLVNKGGRGDKNLDIRTLSHLDVVVTFIPLDEDGNEIPITKDTIIYDEDMNIIPPIKGGD